jgi:hypothetical protein
MPALSQPRSPSTALARAADALPKHGLSPSWLLAPLRRLWTGISKARIPEPEPEPAAFAPVIIIDPTGAALLGVEHGARVTAHSPGKSSSVSGEPATVLEPVRVAADGSITVRVQAALAWNGSKVQRLCATLLGRQAPKASGASGDYVLVATHCFGVGGDGDSVGQTSRTAHVASQNPLVVRSSRQLTGYFSGLYEVRVVAIGKRGLLGRDHAPFQMSGNDGVTLIFDVEMMSAGGDSE